MVKALVSSIKNINIFIMLKMITKVQALVSNIKMFGNLLSTIPAFVCVSFLGPLSDQVSSPEFYLCHFESVLFLSVFLSLGHSQIMFQVQIFIIAILRI